MSFSYNLELTDDVSKVRLLIQDNIEIYKMLEDEEIQFLINSSGNIYKAAAEAALLIYNGFVQEYSVAQTGKVRVESSERMKYYKNIYDELKLKASTQNGFIPPVFIGGADRPKFVTESEGKTVDQYSTKFFDL